MFGIDDIHKLRLEGSAAHEEAIHIRLARQLLAGCPGHRTWEGRRDREWSGKELEGQVHPQLGLEPNPLTSVDDTGALSHRIRDVGLKPSPELFMYLLGLEREARLHKPLSAFHSEAKRPWAPRRRGSVVSGQELCILGQNTTAPVLPRPRNGCPWTNHSPSLGLGGLIVIIIL